MADSCCFDCWGVVRVVEVEMSNGGKRMAWQAHDLIPGRSYETLNFGLVKYEGLDTFWGDVTHEFSTKVGPRYWKTEKLGEFLKPREDDTPPLEERIPNGLPKEMI